MGGRGGLHPRIRLERQGRVGAPPRRPASRLPPPAERQHDLPRLGGGAAGDREAHPGRACPARCIPTAACTATTSSRSRRTGKTVWEWHACRDMEVEKYPLVSNQLRDEFAHANAIFAAAERRHLHQLPPPQHDRADRPADPQDEMGAPRRQLRHAARLRAAAERQRHAVRQRHQHHDQSVLARDRARPAHAQDRVGISRQADLHVLQPAHQRRAAARRAATR